MMTKNGNSRISLLREFSVPLLVGVVAAMVWVNLDSASYQGFVYGPIGETLNLHFYVNDIFMVFFFGIAAAEITGSFLPGGSLRPMSKAFGPLLATLGGVMMPAAVYLALNAWMGSRELTRGWGISTATDIALAWLVARTVFGGRHPAVAFLLLLAVADDAIGLAIIAVFYPDPQHPVSLAPLALVAGGVACSYVLRRLRVTNYWPYLLLGGGACWTGLFLAHLHPALALVLVVPFMPHAIRADEIPFDVEREDNSPLAQFEHEWKVIVDFGLLMFGLTNAGVEFSSVGAVTWIVLASLVVGKTVGVVGFALLGKALGLPLPEGVGRRELLLVGMIAGIGLTVALFIAGAAFVEPNYQGAAKMGALLSAGAAIPAIILGKILRVKARRGS